MTGTIFYMLAAVIVAAVLEEFRDQLFKKLYKDTGVSPEDSLMTQVKGFWKEFVEYAKEEDAKTTQRFAETMKEIVEEEVVLGNYQMTSTVKSSMVLAREEHHKDIELNAFRKVRERPTKPKSKNRDRHTRYMKNKYLYDCCKF